MATQEIVTIFTAETAELDAALAKATKGMEGFEQAEVDATKAGQNLSGSLGNVAQKTGLVVESAKRSTAAMQEVGKATQSTGGLFAQLGQRIKGVFSGAASNLKGFRDSLTGVAQSVPGIGSAFSALTNPIGLAAAAVGGLLLNFTKLDSVSDTIEKVKAGFSSFLDSLAGNASLADTIDGIERAVELAERLDQLNRGKVLDTAAVTDARANAALLERQARNTTLSTAERVTLLRQANAELEKAANIDLSNSTKEADIAYETLVNKVIQQNAGLSEGYKKQLRSLSGDSAEALRQVRGLAASGLEVDDATLKAYIDSFNARKNGEVEIALLRERNSNRIDALTKGEAEASAALSAKQQADAAKAAAAAEQAAEKKAQAEERYMQAVQDAAKQREDLEAEALRASLSRSEQEVFDIERAGEKKLETTAKIYENLRTLAEQSGNTGAIPGLNAEQAAQEALIREETGKKVNAKIAEQLAEEEKIRTEGREKIADALLTEEEKEIEDIRSKYAILLEENRKFWADSNGITEEGKKNEAALIAKQEEEIEAAKAEQAAKDQAAQLERQQQSLDLLTESSAQAVDIVAQAAAGGQATADEAAKALTLLALDTIEKLVLLNAINAQTGAIAFGTATAGPAGTLAGAIQGAAVAALIKGLFAALKAQVQGAYTGEAFIDGPAAFPGEQRDAHLRRVHYGERIVTADANRKHWDILQAVAADKVDSFIESRYVIPAVNAYMNGDTGQRLASSVMLAQYYDKNIVMELKRNRESVDTQTAAIIAALSNTNGRTRGHRRYW